MNAYKKLYELGYTERTLSKMSEEQLNAVVEMEKLAVAKYRMSEPYFETFDDIFVRVRHELDMFEEGEETPLKDKEIPEIRTWLKKYRHLREYNGLR